MKRSSKAKKKPSLAKRTRALSQALFHFWNLGIDFRLLKTNGAVNISYLESNIANSLYDFFQ